MTIIFAEPRFHYASYEDLRALIRLSNFDTCFIDQIDPQSENVYIITILNGELPSEGYPDARARIILWDLEYHLDNPPHIEGVEVWACDAWYAEQIGAKYVPMGSHVGLRTNVPSNWTYPESDHRWDVAYLGFIRGLHRREVIERQLMDRGVRLSPIVAWGDERDLVLRSCIIYLHVHQHAHIPAVPPLRMVVAAAYSLPVISEMCADAGIFDVVIEQSLYADLSLSVWGWVTDQDTSTIAFLKERGAALHRLLCEELTFRKSVEGAL